MRMSFFSTRSNSAFSGILCLIVAAGLAGCASKNPLMEEPVIASNASTQAVLPKTVETAPADASATSKGGFVTTAPTRAQRVLGIFSPHRIDIQQGNFISREMVDQLKEGMQRQEGVTPEQVRFVLGTPLLTDIFHADRWDYLFRLKKSTGEVLSSRVTVFFKDNRVARIEDGDGTLPTEEEYLALIAGSVPGSAQQNK